MTEQKNWTVKYNGYSLQAPGDLTVEDIQRAMADSFPAVANARPIVDEETRELSFVVTAGVKG
jgi:hypothetical protein